MQTSIHPTTLSMFFSKFLPLLKATFKRNLIIALVLSFVSFLLLALGVQTILIPLTDIFYGENIFHYINTNPGEIPTIIFSLFVMFLSLTGYLCISVSTTIVVASEITNQKISWQEALKIGTGKRLLRIIALTILLTLGFIIIVGAASLVTISLTQENAGLLSMLSGGFIMLVVFLFLIFISLLWQFADTIIAWENGKVFSSLNRSGFLVQGNWWRVFGILLLFSIISSVISWMITLPLSLIHIHTVSFNIKDIYQGIFESKPSNLLSDISMINKSAAIRLAITNTITTILSSVYVTLLYFDLRARNGEFEDESEIQDLDQTTIS